MRPLLITLIFVGLLGCQKDQLTFTGRLNVTFTNSSELTLGSKIYELSNLNYPLFENLAADSKGNLTIELNYGNYLIEYFRHDDLNGGNFSQRRAFQITPDKTTNLTINL
ncbi:MAG: hypothetical protein KA713_09190 [Chryseotalea sp. WA131a]|nr:MAG: hypothetical protein KA713_00985 [Chryseotalea sp. WA131a]UXE68721.1 MAG: hypothetical protein KA713_09190 [Chryseotalea sp. WA131a]